jgi:DNA-binding transcriptional regulator PaaX
VRLRRDDRAVPGAAKHTRQITLASLGGRLLRLTYTVRLDLLGGADPEVQWSRPWDGLWRIVAFDVPESKAALRTRLRRRLHEYKFGWLEKSVWINPHPVDLFQEVAGEDGIDPESLVCFDARPRGGENQAALVNRAWDFSRLTKDYTGYMEILRIRPERSGRTSTVWFRWLETEHRAWRQIARRDPFLPAVLLPRGLPWSKSLDRAAGGCQVRPKVPSARWWRTTTLPSGSATSSAWQHP